MVPTLKHIADRVGKYIWPAAAVCLGLLTNSPASAQTACVQCTGPEQVYRCEATADEPIPSQTVGLFCVSKIASEHAHEACGVRRGDRLCGGVSVSYVYDENFGSSAAAAEGSEHGPNRNASGEPATLGEFTKDTVAASAQSAKNAGKNLGSAASKAGAATTDAIKDAGSAIGNATKKTLNCLGSALNDC